MISWPWGRKYDERKGEVAETVRANEEAQDRLMRALEETRRQEVAALLGGLVPARKGQSR